MHGTGAEELAEEILQRKAELRVGKTLRDKWHLDSLIGVGGMAAVYEATHRNGMRGAVKILHPHRAADEAVKKRFLREGYIANKIGHGGAVKILDDDEDGDDVFLVMELLEGVTLEARAYRAGGTLEASETMSLVDPVLDMLVAAHEKRIFHRDLKPANIFITHAGVVKVLDYGIAALAEPSSASSTQAGVGMGTPSFMAPEQARGKWDEVDAQSDVWSLAATMFWLLSGTTVHEDGTVQEIVARTFMVQARELRSVAPDVPKELAEIVDRALRLEKSERWPDARAMQLALRAAWEEMHDAPLPRARAAATTALGALPTESRVFPATPPDPFLPATAAAGEILPSDEKTSLIGTESNAEPRRRDVAIAGVVWIVALAVVGAAIWKFTTMRTDEPPSLGAPGASSVETPIPAPAESATVEPAPPATSATSAPSAPFAASAAPAKSVAPSTSAPPPSASTKPDAGKRAKPSPAEDSIF
ncbi:MAG: protein kinase [Labilithrix sp.]|nr:protein kinase [Labilithrix sp.]